jgi:molecular chaperone DnaK
MDQARDRLTQASHKLAEQMYRAAQPQGGAGADPNAGTGGPPPPASGGQAKHDAGVVDAEYVDVDEKKTA